MDLPALGERFEDRYLLVELLGEGGFARVYRAHDEAVGRDVAIKILSPTGGKYREITAARFMREVRLIAELQDPHTVTLFDFGQTADGLLYMACEYVPGRDLKRILDERQKLPPRTVAYILDQVLQSLREAHARNITHRDIKPANILIYEYEGDPYRAKLLDFGLAKPSSVDATQITRAGYSAGTPRYMSPEQVLATPLGPPSDIYSLGLVAYEMLTGEPAVDADDRKELLRKHVTGPRIELPEDCAPLVLRDVIERMLERDLEARYRNVDEVLEDLQAVPRHIIGPSDVSEEAETLPHRSLQNRLAGRAAAASGANAAPQTSRITMVIGFATLAIVAFVGVALLLPTSPPEPEPAVEIPPSVTVVPTRATEPAAHGTDPERDSGSVDATGDGLGSADTAVVTNGCGVERVTAGVHPLTFEVDLVPRTVVLRLPPTYDPMQKHPLLLTFRGRQLRPYLQPDDGRDFLTASGLQKPALERGYIIGAVEPLDLDSPWVWPIDGAFIDAMLDAIDAYACIDLQHLFVVGHDTGAAQAHRFACERSVAGVAIWHELQVVDEPRCVPDPATPVLLIAARRDRDVGSRARRSNCDPTSPIYYGYRDIAEQWRGRNGCAQQGGAEWSGVQRQIGGSCARPSCRSAPYVECVIDDGRQLPFPTNAGVQLCPRHIPSFDLAGNTLGFFEEFRSSPTAEDR